MLKKLLVIQEGLSPMTLVNTWGKVLKDGPRKNCGFKAMQSLKGRKICRTKNSPNRENAWHYEQQ